MAQLSHARACDSCAIHWIEMRGLVIWGLGGHGRVVLDTARAMNVFDQIAFHDDDPGDGTAPISQLSEAGFEEFIIAIGTNSVRSLRFNDASRAGLRPAICVHPTAWISPDACIGAGTVVLARAVVQSNAQIGKNCIINTGAIVEHDCIIGDHTHLSPSTTLGGAVCIGESVHMGIGTIALPGSRIGDRTVIGAGAVVLREIPADVIAMGVPARIRVK
jgi:sugar O-acyltransferase (sialic acid O-acetyltransferase NeuD family)